MADRFRLGGRSDDLDVAIQVIRPGPQLAADRPVSGKSRVPSLYA
jgi:hypothetical protein